jgi:hypothetical protein
LKRNDKKKETELSTLKLYEKNKMVLIFNSQ